MFSLITREPTISVSNSRLPLVGSSKMTKSSLLRKIAIFLAISVTLLLFSGCVLFQVRDCETDELPDKVPTLE